MGLMAKLLVEGFEMFPGVTEEQLEARVATVGKKLKPRALSCFE
jgi:hypothetical protein